MNQGNSTASAPQRLLRLPEVCNQVGLGKSSIYEGVKAGTFPAPIKLSRRAVCWSAAAIDAWITERIKAGRTMPPQVIAARRELWLYQLDKPTRVPPADSPNRPALARLWLACNLAVKRRPKLRTFIYCGVRFGVVYVGARLGVLDLSGLRVMVLAPGSQHALATMLNLQGASHG